MTCARINPPAAPAAKSDTLRRFALPEGVWVGQTLVTMRQILRRHPLPRFGNRIGVFAVDATMPGERTAHGMSRSPPIDEA